MTSRLMLLIENAWSVEDGPMVGDNILVGVEDDLVVIRRQDSDDNVGIDLADFDAIVELVNGYRPSPNMTPPQNPIDPGFLVPTPSAPPAPPEAEPARVAPPTDDAAICSRLRQLSADDYMPTRDDWDANRGDLPSYAALDRRRKWRFWAQAAGLKMRRRGQPKANQSPAPPPAAQPAPPAPTNGAPIGPPPGHMRKSATSIVLTAAERDSLIAQARAVVNDIAADGPMPRQRDYDLHRQPDAPHGGELLHLLSLASWRDLADLLGLEYVK